MSFLIGPSQINSGTFTFGFLTLMHSMRNLYHAAQRSTTGFATNHMDTLSLAPRISMDMTLDLVNQFMKNKRRANPTVQPTSLALGGCVDE